MWTDYSLFAACANNNIEILKAILVRSTSSINSRNEDGLTALHICAINDSAECAELILSSSPSSSSSSSSSCLIDCPNFESGWTPLHCALYNRSIRTALVLLRFGAQLDRIPIGANQVQVSCHRDDQRRIRSWTKWTANIDHEGLTPLALLSTCLQSSLDSVRTPSDIQCSYVYAYGVADFALGIPLPRSMTEVSRPRRIETLATEIIVQIAVGKFHSFAVSKSGRCFAWGQGHGGRLGLGDEHPRQEPCLIEALSRHRIVSVCTSDYHALAISEGGALYSWGSDKYGQLGHGNSGTKADSILLFPRQITSLQRCRVLGAAAGEQHSVCFTDSAELFAWGCNNSGQLGCRPAECPTISNGIGYCLTTPKVVSAVKSLLRQRHDYDSQHISSKRFDSSFEQVDTVALCPIVQISAGSACTLMLVSNSHRDHVVKVSRQSKQLSFVYQWGYGNASPSLISFPHPNSTRLRSDSLSSDVSVATAYPTGVRSLLSAWSAAHRRSNSSNNAFVESPVNILCIAAGDRYHSAVSWAGHVYTWGVSETQTARGSNEIRSVMISERDIMESPTISSSNSSGLSAEPMLVESLMFENGGCNAISVTVSVQSSAVVSSCGDVYTWSKSEVPRRVLGVKRAIAAVVGSRHTLVLQSLQIPNLVKDHVVADVSVANGDIDELKTTAVIGTTEITLGENSSTLCSYDDHYWGLDVDNETFRKLDLLAENENKISYNFPTLSELCQESICQKVTIRNIVDYLSIANSLQCQQLLSFCVSFVDRNFDAFLVNSKLLELPDVISTANVQIHTEINGVKRSKHSVPYFKPLLDDELIPIPSIVGDCSDSLPKRIRQRSFDDNQSAMDFKTLTTVHSIEKAIRATKKKLSSISEIEHKIMSLPGDILSAEPLSLEQEAKIGRKQSLVSTLETLQSMLARISGEERIRAKAASLRTTLQPDVGSASTAPSSLPLSNNFVDHLSATEQNQDESKLQTDNIIEPPLLKPMKTSPKAKAKSFADVITPGKASSVVDGSDPPTTPISAAASTTAHVTNWTSRSHYSLSPPSLSQQNRQESKVMSPTQSVESLASQTRGLNLSSNPYPSLLPAAGAVESGSRENAPVFDIMAFVKPSKRELKQQRHQKQQKPPEVPTIDVVPAPQSSSIPKTNVWNKTSSAPQSVGLATGPVCLTDIQNEEQLYLAERQERIARGQVALEKFDSRWGVSTIPRPGSNSNHRNEPGKSGISAVSLKEIMTHEERRLKEQREEEEEVLRAIQMVEELKKKEQEEMVAKSKSTKHRSRKHQKDKL